ncbi:MAG: arylamine N-acetyltransferase family protein, partial [Acidobacteriota bacterium]
MDVAAYLDRIGYSGPTEPTAETLCWLHRAHMLTVPFENLDIALHRAILLDRDKFIKKIVGERRGGFCYELNGAFAALLEELGFEVTLLSARVPRQDGSESPEFDHLTLRVDLEEPWLADVWFGDFILEPLRLSVDLEQKQDAGVF